MTHTPTSQMICVGCVIGAHGIKGALRVRSFTEYPEDLFAYKPLQNQDGSRSFDLEPLGAMKDHFIAKLRGIDDRTQAEALKGTRLYIARDAIPAPSDRTYFAADLIGLVALDDRTQEKVGVVTQLHDHGAGAFLEIKPERGESFMLPFKDAFVPTVDRERGTLTTLVPDGWIEDPALKEAKKAAKPKKKRSLSSREPTESTKATEATKAEPSA